MFDRRQFGALMLGGLAAPAAFAARRDAIATPLTLEDNRLWIAGSIGDSKPMLFVIDTGAGHDYIRPEIARRLKLQQAGTAIMRGLGKNTAQGAMFVAHNILLGGTMVEPTVAFAGYDFGHGLPNDAAGLMTAGLFTTRDSDIDFDRSEWRLWRDGRPDRQGLVALEASRITGPGRSDLYSHRMFVQATLDGGSYRLLVDTGSPGTLLLNPRASARSGLFADDRPYAPERTRGFGGDAARLSRRVRAGRFDMGPLTVDRPLVTLMDPRQQDDTDDHDGVLGLHWISLLNWSTDVRASRLWAARNTRQITAEPYLLSAIWLEQDGDGHARVADVGGGSPAYRAGLRAGDVIVSPPDLGGAVQAVSGQPGKTVALRVRSAGGAERAVSYTLQPYL